MSLKVLFLNSKKTVVSVWLLMFVTVFFMILILYASYAWTRDIDSCNTHFKDIILKHCPSILMPQGMYAQNPYDPDFNLSMIDINSTDWQNE